MTTNTDPTKKILNIRMPANLYEKLRELANADQRSINNLVVKFLTERLTGPYWGAPEKENNNE